MTINQINNSFTKKTPKGEISTIDDTNYFLDVKQKFKIFHDDNVNAMKYQFIFYDKVYYFSMYKIFQQKYTLFLISKIMHIGSKMKAYEKIFFDIIIDILYFQDNIELS